MYGSEIRAGSWPWACSQRIAPPSGCRHTTAEYGTESGAQPEDSTVAVTVVASLLGDKVNEQGGGGGAGARGLACAMALLAPNATAHVTQTTTGRPIRPL